MAKLKLLLSGLLFAQLVLALGLYIGRQGGGEFDQKKTLLDVIHTDIDKVVILGENGEIALEKEGESWRLPTYQNLPANQSKLDETVEKLVTLQSGWPVATSSFSRKRFDVSEDKFQRKIQLHSGGELANTVYLGTSPGYRSVHVRRDGDDNIYAVKLATHDFPVKNEDWLDKSLLQVDNVASIKGTDFELQKNGEKWEFVQASVVEGDLPELDESRANEVSAVFENIRVQEVVSDADMNNSFVMVVKDSSGTWTYQFASDEIGYYIRRNDLEMTFSVRDTDYKRIAEASLSSLALQDEEKGPEETVDVSQN